MVEWLPGCGADWRLADYGGKTALDWAKQWGHAEAAGALEAWIAVHGSAEPVSESVVVSSVRPNHLTVNEAVR